MKTKPVVINSSYVGYFYNRKFK